MEEEKEAEEGLDVEEEEDGDGDNEDEDEDEDNGSNEEEEADESERLSPLLASTIRSVITTFAEPVISAQKELRWETSTRRNSERRRVNSIRASSSPLPLNCPTNSRMRGCRHQAEPHS